MTLMIVAGVVIVFLIFLVLFVLTDLAVLPGRIAHTRGHPQADAVQAAGIIGLITGFLWPFAFVWAYIEYPQGGQGTSEGSPRIGHSSATAPTESTAKGKLTATPVSGDPV